MKIHVRIMVVLICVAGMMFAQGSVVAAEREIAEFSFNRPVAVAHARAAIEDFDALMMNVGIRLCAASSCGGCGTGLR